MTKVTVTYPVSDHEWLSVAEMAEKDARIAELEAENARTRLQAFDLSAEFSKAIKLKNERVAELEAENERLKDRINTVFIGGIIKGLEDENDRLHQTLARCTERRETLAAALADGVSVAGDVAEIDGRVGGNEQ